MEVKDRIRKFREKRGLSTTDLSKLTGISQSTISKIENGKRKIDVGALTAIAEALDISIERLTGDAVSCSPACWLVVVIYDTSWKVFVPGEKTSRWRLQEHQAGS